MNEQNNIYYQQKPMMPPPPIWQRVRTKASEMKDAFPKWLTQYSVVVYLLSLAIVSFIYSAYSLPWYYLLSGLVAVLVFFLYGNTLLQKTSIVKMRKERTFEKRLLIYALIPRVLFTLLIYWIFQENYGNEFGFENGDADYYQKQALEFANAMRSGTFITTWNRVSKYIDISDLGYSAYIGFIYWLTGDSIMIVRLIKCLLSAITVLLIYRIAKRNFDEPTARIAAVFCALWPNFWYYCGVHLKETEMVFLGVLFVEQADQMLRSRQFTAWKVIPVLLIAAAIFTVIETPCWHPGIYHFTNEGVCSWFDFTIAIHELAGIQNCKVSPILSEEYQYKTPRPHYSVLDKSKFKKTFGVEIPYWREALIRCVKKLS